MKRIIVTLTIGALICFALSCVNPWNWDIRPTQAEIDQFWLQKVQAGTQFNIVLMGDSRAGYGLSVTKIEATLPGLRALNFFFNSGGLNPEMYAAAERKLNPDGAIRIVVLGIAPSTLTDSAAENTLFHQYEKQDNPFIKFFGNYVRHFTPLTPGQVVDSFRGLFPLRSGAYGGYFADGMETTMNWPLPEGDPTSTVLIEKYRNIYKDTPVSVELVNSLIDQTQHWSQQGILVVAFRFPVSARMLDFENQVSGFKEAPFVERFVQAGGHWFRFQNENYRTLDGSHLFLDDAYKFSTDLARQLRDELIKSGKYHG